jgi:hypothetical protein
MALGHPRELTLHNWPRFSPWCAKVKRPIHLVCVFIRTIHPAQAHLRELGVHQDGAMSGTANPTFNRPLERRLARCNVLTDHSPNVSDFLESFLQGHTAWTCVREVIFLPHVTRVVVGRSFKFEVPGDRFRSSKKAFVELVILAGAARGSGLIDQFQGQLRLTAQRVRIAVLMSDCWGGNWGGGWRGGCARGRFVRRVWVGFWCAAGAVAADEQDQQRQANDARRHARSVPESA